MTDLVAYGEILKGADWIDPSDPCVVAENELLGAASSIEAAARKLAALKPRSAAAGKVGLAASLLKFMFFFNPKSYCI